MMKGQLVADATPLASFTWSVNVPEAVGVPLMAPVLVFSVRPLGRVPVTENVYGAVPPLTAGAGLFSATPTSPELTAGHVSTTALAMVKGQVVADATPLASFTWSVKVPEAVGVPLIAPVLVFSVKPLGRVPVTEKVYGAVPPLMTGAGLFKATPTSPELTAGQVSSTSRAIVKGQVVAAVTPLASFAWSVNVPEAVGVPLMAPVLVFSVRPLGRVPVTEKVYGAIPPLTAGAGLFRATPASPELTAGQVSARTVAMVNGQVVTAATPLASFTWSVKVPDAVGVPLMAPVLVFSVRPLGRVPVTEKVYGAIPPLTDGAGLFSATPTSPELTAGQVSTTAPAMVKGQVVAAVTPLASFT